MVGTFILFRRDPFFANRLVYYDEYLNLSSLVSELFNVSLFDIDSEEANVRPIYDEINNLCFDLIQSKCSRHEDWEVYYVFRSI